MSKKTYDITKGKKNMDIFDILKAISKKRTEFIHEGMIERDASNKAKFAVSEEYHVPLRDIRKICGV